MKTIKDMVWCINKIKDARHHNNDLLEMLLTTHNNNTSNNWTKMSKNRIPYTKIHIIKDTLEDNHLTISIHSNKWTNNSKIIVINSNYIINYIWIINLWEISLRLVRIWKMWQMINILGMVMNNKLFTIKNLLREMYRKLLLIVIRKVGMMFYLRVFKRILLIFWDPTQVT